MQGFVNLLCITVSAYVAVDGFYETISARLNQRPLSAQQNVYRVNDAGMARPPLSTYDAILERNLFNTRSESEPQSGKVDVASLEETKLDLKLWGTVSGTGDGDYAVIEDVKAREQNLYRSGDSIQKQLADFYTEATSGKPAGATSPSNR